MLTPETLDVDLPGVRLRALTWGPVDGPLVVLLHGFPDTPHSWRHLGPHLAARGWRVVAPWTRGYAPSEVPADGCFAIGALMADAAALHTALGGDDRAALVGHDWGAVTANALGAHPDSPYSRIVSLSVPPLSLLRPGPLVALRQLRLSWYIAFHQLPVLPERVLAPLVRRLWRDWSPGHDASADLPAVLESLSTPAARHAAIGYYRALRRPRRVPSPYRRWHRTYAGVPRVPALLLHGADDGCLQVDLARAAAARLPAAARLRVVPGAGHFLQVERPDEINELVARFLDG